MTVPEKPLPEEPTSRLMDGEATTILIIVGGVALLVVFYLTLDWLKSRREARKLALKRQRAREAWHRELEDMRRQHPPTDKA